jgi:hypothetical protein
MVLFFAVEGRVKDLRPSACYSEVSIKAARIRTHPPNE